MSIMTLPLCLRLPWDFQSPPIPASPAHMDAGIKIQTHTQTVEENLPQKGG